MLNKNDQNKLNEILKNTKKLKEDNYLFKIKQEHQIKQLEKAKKIVDIYKNTLK